MFLWISTLDLIIEVVLVKWRINNDFIMLQIFQIILWFQGQIHPSLSSGTW